MSNHLNCDNPPLCVPFQMIPVKQECNKNTIFAIAYDLLLPRFYNEILCEYQKIFLWGLLIKHTSFFRMVLSLEVQTMK